MKLGEIKLANKNKRDLKYPTSSIVEGMLYRVCFYQSIIYHQ